MSTTDIDTTWPEQAAGMDTVDELAELWRQGAEVHGLDFGHSPVTGEPRPRTQGSGTRSRGRRTNVRLIARRCPRGPR